jgi:hypothetical protein
MEINIDTLTPLIYGELNQAYLKESNLVVSWCFRRCTSKMQQVWESAVEKALVGAATAEGEHGTLARVVRHLSTRTRERDTDWYTLAGVIYEEVLKRYGIVPLGLERPWRDRCARTQEIWSIAIRRALSRTGLSDENPGADEYCLFLPRESADRANAGTPSPANMESEKPHEPTPKPQRPWWRFWR